MTLLYRQGEILLKEFQAQTSARQNNGPTQTCSDQTRPRNGSEVPEAHLQEQWLKTRNLDAMRQMAGSLAHELNNVLTIISGSLELLTERVEADERFSRFAETAKRGVMRGATLNQHLLEFSTRQQAPVQTVSANELLGGCRALLTQATGEAISIEVDNKAATHYCRVDTTQWQKALLNLALNARDAMPEGGTLTISSELRTVDEQTADAFSVTRGDYVAISVCDTGIGIPEDALDRIFEPLFTTKKNVKGAGLGLSQVYGFVRRCAGFITVRSALNEGTQVTMHLPRVND